MTRELRVILADDEEMARLRLRRLLEEHDDVRIVGEARSGKDALAILDGQDVDLALLDVRMGLVSGLEVSEVAADLGVEVVMTTAHRDHAVEAFAAGAVDYLLKPIEAERLAQALSRVRSHLTPSPAPAAAAAVPDRFPLEVRGELLLLRPSDVSHATLDGTLVRVFAGAEGYLTELSLSDLERRLPHLVRVHRKALVSIEHVARLRPLASGGYVAILGTGQEVLVSRQAARELRRRLGI